MEEWDDVHFLIPETAEHVGCSPGYHPVMASVLSVYLGTC